MSKCEHCGYDTTFDSAHHCHKAPWRRPLGVSFSKPTMGGQMPDHSLEVETARRRIAELEAYNSTRTDELLAATRRIVELERKLAAERKMYDDLNKYCGEVEIRLSVAQAELESALAKSASREAALVEALREAEAVLAATQEVYGACLGPKTHEGINATLAKIKEA